MTANLHEDWRLREVAAIEPGIVCIDIERMIAFYTGVLGLEVINDAQTAPAMSTKFGAAPDGYRIVRLQTARGQKIKLVQPRQQPARNPLHEWVFQRQGIVYLTFVVEDVADVVARLKANGVRMASEGAVEIRKGILAIYTLDPEDNYLEFVEYPAQRKS